MAHSNVRSLTRPYVRIHGDRLYWPGRLRWHDSPAAAATSAADEISVAARLRNGMVLLVVSLYLLLNWGFQQVRIPPVGGGGLPSAEIALVLFLLTIHPSRTLARLGGRVYLLPFVIWWTYGLGRTLVDTLDVGFWALRDAAHVIESLYLVVGFVFAAHQTALERFFTWLPRILFIGAGYGLLYPVNEILWSISPEIMSSNGYPVPIIGTMANTAFIMIMAAFYLLLFHGGNVVAIVVATFLIGFPLAMVQARTLYLVTIVLFGFLVAFRRTSTGNVALVITLGAFGLAVMSLVGLQLQGRLGASVSLEFLAGHFLTIFGICSTDLPGVCSAAGGVHQRLGWWENILDQMLVDPFNVLFGLGYGVVLTDHYSLSGAAVREPHNSYVTIFARTGVIGIICWVAMMASLVHRWLLAYRHCAGIGWRVGQNRLMILMVFFISMWILAIGEDGFEKPYNIVPFYFFWGIVLRFGLLSEQERIGPRADAYEQPQAERPGYHASETPARPLGAALNARQHEPGSPCRF